MPDLRRAGHRHLISDPCSLLSARDDETQAKLEGLREQSRVTRKRLCSDTNNVISFKVENTRHALVTHYCNCTAPPATCQTPCAASCPSSLHTLTQPWHRHLRHPVCRSSRPVAALVAVAIEGRLGRRSLFFLLRRPPCQSLHLVALC